MLREFLLCSKMSQLYVFIYPIHTYRSRQHWVHFPVLSCRSLLVIDFIHTTGYKILGHSRSHPNCQGQIENSSCVCVCVRALSQFSPVWLFVTPWTEALQAPPSMGFSRQEYWSGLPFPSPGDLPDSGIEPEAPTCPALQVDFYHWTTWSLRTLCCPSSVMLDSLWPRGL